MKNLFSKIMFFAVAAMAFASCSNDEIYVAPETEGFEVSINANTTDTTRSAFGDYNEANKTYPTLWEGNETWFAAINDKYTKSIETITFSNDLKSANANFELSGVPSASDDGTYTLYALSPASAWSSYNLSNDYLRFYIARSTQTPNANSCDPASQVLFAKSEPMANANSFDVDFKHLSAYVKFSFTNVAEGGVVSSVSVTSEDVNLAGRYQYTPSTGELVELDNLAKGITLVTNSTENLWLAVAPVDVSGKVLTFSITTDKGILAKEVTMPTTAKFESGKVVTFNVNMEGIEPSALTTYNLLTNIDELNAGDKIIIAAAESNVALSTTQNGNNRGQAAITKSEDRSTISYGVDVQILTVEPGTTAGTFAFNTGSGYLCAASSSSNYLRTEATLSANSSWTIEIADSVATIIAQGTNTRNYMQYNATNSLFACYASTKNMDPIAIYYLDGNYLAVSTDTISFTAEGGEETFTVSKNFDASVSVTCDNDWFAITGDNSYTVTAPKNETTEEITGTITVTAGEFTKTIAVTQKAVPVEAEAITIAEFIDKADTTTEYKLTGTISRVVNETFGNFDITEGSSTIYVYGLLTPDGTTQKQWADAKLKLGDVITLQGVYSVYNDSPQIKNATYVSHYGVKAEKTSVEIDAIGGESTIAISLVNTDEAITATSDNAHFRATIDGKNLVISADANETEAAITGTITIKAGRSDCRC